MNWLWQVKQQERHAYAWDTLDRQKTCARTSLCLETGRMSVRSRCGERRLVATFFLFVTAVKLHLGSGVCSGVFKVWASGKKISLFLFGGTHTSSVLLLLPKFPLLAKCQPATIFGHKLTRSNLLWKDLVLISGNQSQDNRYLLMFSVQIWPNSSEFLVSSCRVCSRNKRKGR